MSYSKSIFHRPLPQLILALAPGIIFLGIGAWLLLSGGAAYVWPLCVIPILSLSIGSAYILSIAIVFARPRILKIIFAIGLFAVLICATTLVSTMRTRANTQFPIFEKAAKAITVGMTKEQVIGLLGKPLNQYKTDRKTNNATAVENWVYGGARALQGVDIDFDADGKVIESRYDF